VTCEASETLVAVVRSDPRRAPDGTNFAHTRMSF
jgi:hypothetical protein